MDYIYIGLPLSVIVALVFYFYLPDDLETIKAPKWWMAFIVIAVLQGLLWTYILSGFLIDLLNCFGIIFNLGSVYLGLSILAVGNALPDALTTLALVKSGSGTMAISGAYAGQLFGLLIGFGLAQLKTTLMNGPQAFDIFQDFNKNKEIIAVLFAA